MFAVLIPSALGQGWPQRRAGGAEKADRILSELKKAAAGLGYGEDLRRFPNAYEQGQGMAMGDVVSGNLSGGKMGPQGWRVLNIWVTSPEEAAEHYAKFLADKKKEHSSKLKGANKIERSERRGDVTIEAVVFKEGPGRFLYGEVGYTAFSGENEGRALSGDYVLGGHLAEVYYELRLSPARSWRSDPGQEASDASKARDKDEVKPLACLDDAGLPYFSDLLALEAAVRGGPAPGWGDAPEPKHYVTLEAKASPGALRPDGDSRSVITVSVKERAEDTDVAPRPRAGAAVSFELVASDGFVAGSLSASQAVTGPDGAASVTFTAPEREASGKGKVRRAEVKVASNGVEDRVFVDLLSDEAKLTVSPALDGASVPTALIPADKRFPASLTAVLSDRDGRPRKGESVTFSLEAKEPRGLLRAGAGASGPSVTAETDENGVARALYVYEGPPVEDKPWEESVLISAKDLPEPLRAGVSVGMKLAISRVRSMHEGKGMLNAGETVPLEIAVKDKLHPQVRDLEKVLAHWVGNADGAPGLAVRLFIRPEGNVPDYLVEQLLLKTWPPEPFKDLVSARFIEKFGETLLWVAAGQDYEGMPRVRPRFTGENYYSIRAGLVERDNGKAVGSKPGGSCFLTLKAGPWADAGRIFLVDDPFGEHTPEAKLFRQVLKLAGAGVVLDLTEVAALANKGDVDKLAELAITAAKDKLMGMVSDKINEKADEYLSKLAERLGEEAAAAYAAVTMVQEVMGKAEEALETADETLLAAGYDAAKLAGAEREAPEGRDPFVAKIMDKVRLTGKRLLISTAGELLDKEGKPLPGMGKVAVSDRGVVALKKDGLCIYIVPTDLELAPGQRFEEYASPR
jgi:hypothetical protein